LVDLGWLENDGVLEPCTLILNERTKKVLKKVGKGNMSRGVRILAKFHPVLNAIEQAFKQDYPTGRPKKQ